MAWGKSLRQRVRLTPLYVAVALADRLAAIMPRSAGRRPLPPWKPGISVIIPERDAPDLLAAALSSVNSGLAELSETSQIVVVANGAPADRYAALRKHFPGIDWLAYEAPLGFTTAIAEGLRVARYDWTLLLNNDMTLAPGTLSRLCAERSDGLFAAAAEIVQRSADGRREETGFVDWYADASGIHVYHAPVPVADETREHLCASGGAALFRTAHLRRYARRTRCYDPFYWEDVEWGVRAHGDRLRVAFCSGALATHRHRATTSRFYPPSELDRIVERNRILFDLRNAATRLGAGFLLSRVCDLPYQSQRELSRVAVALDVFARRSGALRVRNPARPPQSAAPGRPFVNVTSSYSFSLVQRRNVPCVVLVTPFCVFPPRHGGARRIEGLLTWLRRDFDVVLVSDEASLYRADSFASLDGLLAVSLVQRSNAPGTAGAPSPDFEQRMQSHVHVALTEAVTQAIARFKPDIVQIEYAELAALASLRRVGERWVLALHDAWRPDDFTDQGQATRMQRTMENGYDAVTVCSAEDRALIAHPATVCVPNGTNMSPDGYVPSASLQLLFMGPFRYPPNLEGIREFVCAAYPRIAAAVPGVSLAILGGDEGPRLVAADPAFAQPGISIVTHRTDVTATLAAAAFTINPLRAIRGSSIKVIESLMAGRACVSTSDGARGFRDARLAGLVTVDDVASMVGPAIALLTDIEYRHRIEAPDRSRLATFSWKHCADIQRDLYRSLLERRDA